MRVSSVFRRNFSNYIPNRRLNWQIKDYAKKEQRGFTLKEMMSVGNEPSEEQVIQNARFLYSELPVRLAKRAVELESLPYGLPQIEEIQRVRSWYEQSINDVLSVREPRTPEQDVKFTQTLERILDRHSNVVPTIAQGVLQINQRYASLEESIDKCPFLQTFLDGFYSSRIGLRVLISQHIALHHPQPGFIGIIQEQIEPAQIAQDAISDASRTCEREYGNCPEVVMLGDLNHKLAYVPSHLHHMLYELLKNSMRAVVEFHGVNNYDLPDIEIVFAMGEKDFCIKITDQGGGIERHMVPRVWSYLHSTAKKPLIHNQDVNDTSQPTNTPFSAQAPMAGFGYGLPLSRCFSQFFGGDLQLISMESHGTDAYLYLNHLNDHKMFLR